MTAESREQEPLDNHRAPERTPDQRMDALSKANEVRARRAQLKRDLKSGRVSLAALIVDPPQYLETAKVLLRFRDKLGTGGPFGAATIAGSINLTAFSHLLFQTWAPYGPKPRCLRPLLVSQSYTSPATSTTFCRLRFATL